MTSPHEELKRTSSLIEMVEGELITLKQKRRELVRQVGKEPKSERERKLLSLITTHTSIDDAWITDRFTEDGVTQIHIRLEMSNKMEDFFLGGSLFVGMANLKYRISHIDKDKMRVYG